MVGTGDIFLKEKEKKKKKSAEKPFYITFSPKKGYKNITALFCATFYMINKKVQCQ
jgi:hypothetical protein